MKPISRREFVIGIGSGFGSMAASGGELAAGAGPRRLVPSTPATAGKLRKIRDIVVYRDPEYFCEPGPSPLSLGDGTVLMAFRRSREVGHSHPEVEMCLLRSHDGGETWGHEPQVFDSGLVTNANLTLLRDGTVLYATHCARQIDRRTFERLIAIPQNHHLVEYYDDRTVLDILRLADGQRRPEAPALLWSVYTAEAGTCVRRSLDQGRTWSPQFWVSPIEGVSPILPGMPSPAAIRSPAFVLADNSLVIPVYYYAMGPATGVYLMESPDGGLTWKLRGTIARPHGEIGFDETVIYECASGKLVAFLRTSNAGGYIYTGVSLDGGRIWSEPRKEDLWGHPCTAIRMPSGRVLVAYGYRRRPYGVRARLVDAECEHIGDAEEFVIRDDGGTGDLGYPLATLLPNGSALVAYYFNRKEDNGERLYIAASTVAEA